MVRDLSVLHPHHINRFEMNLAMGRSDAEERSIMRPMVGLVGCHTISIGKLPVNLCMKVGECRTHVGVELSDTGLVGSRPRLRCVVNKVVGEQFFEHLEVPLALDFLGIAADDSLRGIAYCGIAHSSNPLKFPVAIAV